MNRIKLAIQVLVYGEGALRDLATVAWQHGHGSRWEPSRNELNEILRRWLAGQPRVYHSKRADFALWMSGAVFW